ncbi:MAG: protein kinase [Byssovorax sp.]
MTRCALCSRRLGAGSACPLHPEVRAPGGEPEEAASPPEVAGYARGALLGRGGFARVFAATRLGDGQAVALKIAHSVGDLRFAREAAALRRLDARAAPALFDEGSAIGGQPFLAMERVAGASIAALLAALPGAGAAPLASIASLLRELARAIDRVHDAGLVHRDLKPENAVLRADSAITLLDFGLASGAGLGAAIASPEASLVELTRTGQILGTAVYMAPEQCLDAREVDGRADVYSLGVMLFELLTARPPFVGDAAAIRHAHVARRPERPGAIAPLSAAIDDVVLRCLAKDPTARFARAGDVAAALVPLLVEAAAGASSARGVASSTATAAPAKSGPARRTVALLAVRSSAPAEVFAAALAPEGGVVARFQGTLRVVAFPAAASVAHGIRAAQRTARRLAAITGAGTERSALVHAAEVRVREGARSTWITGDAVDHVDRWATVGDGVDDLIVTEAAAAVLAADRSESSEGSADLAPIDAQRSPLRGREALLDAVIAEARGALATGTPALITLLGDTGHGKTRLCDALAAAMAEGSFAAVVTLRAPRLDAIDPGAALRSLLRAAFALDAEVDLDLDVASLRRACAAGLGEAAGEAAWPSVALSLGLIAESDPAVAPLAGASGAVRHAVAKAAAAALRARGPLVVILDDAHRADPAVIDALELATMAGSPARLVVIVAARPALTALRPGWGDRAARCAIHLVLPLDAASADALLLDHLHPVEFVPRPLLERLHELTRGVPLDLVELTHALRIGGAIRRLPGGAGWSIAPDELLRRSPTALADRLADRALAALPAPLLALTRLCAVIGDDLAPAEIEAIERLLGASLGAEAVDPGVGLAQLARAGLLVPHPRAEGHRTFRHPMVRDAIEARTPAPLRRAFHAAALADLATLAERPLARIARHAAAAGERQIAADTHAELADQARRRHDFVDAEQHETATLELLDEADVTRRERALGGRGKVRYRLHRSEEALCDLRAARALAEARGDAAAAVDLLLEEATVLDWLEDFLASSIAGEEAAARARDLGDPRLDARCLLALGRSACRTERVAEGILQVEEASRRALSLGDHEGRVIALLILVGALTMAGRLDEAEPRGEEVIAVCERAGDAFHLCGAYINRVFLWVKRRAHDRALADQRRAVALARELGHARLERLATFNLAELLFWSGSLDEALPLARRCRDLQLRFFNQRPTPYDALLLARIHLAAADDDAALAQLAEVRATCVEADLPAYTRTLVRLVQRSLDDRSAGHLNAGAWAAVIAEALETATLHEHLEALHAAVLTAIHVGSTDEARGFIDQAEATAEGFWRPRFTELRARIAAGQPS